MQLELYYLAIPDEIEMAALDKWFATVAKHQAAIDNGRRIWVTHVPETSTRPFLNPMPFDISYGSVKIGQAEREEYQVSLGAIPKRRMVCSAFSDDETSFDVLLVIALELMRHSKHVFLAVDNELGQKLLGPGKFGEPYDAGKLATFPGAAYEVNHEDDDGNLNSTWFVDSRWLRAWKQNHEQIHARQNGSTFDRFASLDYV